MKVSVTGKTFPENWDSNAPSVGTLLAYLETTAKIAREAFRNLVESLEQMSSSISRIFLKLVELQFSLGHFSLFQQNNLVNALIWQIFWKVMI